ncbi:uncharacterized protein LOC8032616 isoform X1 [Ixodes scapularis]|uniref:uncharacterized protein LOC8032616 isoform X1 n=1 Tax=Ixodes scapularis TaxID=6945 RepID=UPI001A9F83A4|nr:uncharacterized protein LOC8032616 isoform X1 [Ixodes scapularis]
MAPMPPLGGLVGDDTTTAAATSSLVLRGVLAASACGRFFTWNPDETDGSGEQSEEDIQRKTQRSISECYFAVKGTALVLPHDESMHVYRCSNNNVVAGDIRAHLQSMLYMLRREDTLKMAVKLESQHPSSRTRYLVVVSRPGPQGSEEACLLGIDCNHCTTIGLVIPVWADSRITLDGDGGFSVASSSGHYIFKPVSVQAMWSALQSLHKACAKAREFNYFQGGGTHLWVNYYADRIHSDQSCLNEWHAMDDLVSRRPPTPDYDRSKPTEKDETEALIRSKLKELMMSVDLDEVTSKFIRTRLEEELDMSLREFKPFIDQEMLTILGQMDAATEILEYLYLGSEWNASNLEELKDKGVGHILNVTREIDNFYPGLFDYFNIRVYDDETTEMLKHWDRTYKYIAQAKEQGSKVLVHCKMGISRSASVVIAYVMKAYDLDLDQALEFVKRRRSCIKPNSGFLKQLETYRGILNASKQRHNSIWRSKSETNLKYEKPKRTKKQEGSDGRSATESLCGHMSLLVPGSVARPKSWSPDDAASSVFFSVSNNDLPSASDSITPPGKTRSSRKRLSRPRYGTDPACYPAAFVPPDAPPDSPAVVTTGTATIPVTLGTDPNPRVGGSPKPCALPSSLLPSKPGEEEDQGLHRVASVKDRICELESQAVVTKPASGKAPLKPDAPRIAATSAATMTTADPNVRSKLLLNLANPPCYGKNDMPLPTEDCTTVAIYNVRTYEPQGVEPVASQTKPPTPKHTAVIVKPTPPWSSGGAGDVDGGDTADVAPAPSPKDVFSSALRRDAEDGCPRFPAPTAGVPCHMADDIRSADASHSPERVPWEEPRPRGTLFPAEICKLQIGFAEGAAAEARKENVVPVLAELQVDGQRSEDPSREKNQQGKVCKTKCRLEGFAQSLRFDGRAFPSQTRSMPSTPPETVAGVCPTSPSKQILRSQSLRSERRPKSLALPKYVARSPPKFALQESPPIADDQFGLEISHSASTPSVVEAVNEVLRDTERVISGAFHLLPPTATTPPRARSADADFGSPTSLLVEAQQCPLEHESSCGDVPLAGIVKQQRAMLEGLQPQHRASDRKPPAGDSRSKKDQARFIRELGSSLVPGDTPVTAEAEEEESAVGVVKRLTKELEAKARNGKAKPGTADRLVIVERDGREQDPASTGSSSTPNSPVCERHGCGAWGPRGPRAFSECRPPPAEPPPPPSRHTSLDAAEKMRKASASRGPSSAHPTASNRGGELPLPPKVPPPGVLFAMMPPGVLPGGLQRKIRKQQGKTHPLSKLAARQRHPNPLYNTM